MAIKQDSPNPTTRLRATRPTSSLAKAAESALRDLSRSMKDIKVYSKGQGKVELRQRAKPAKSPLHQIIESPQVFASSDEFVERVSQILAEKLRDGLARRSSATVYVGSHHKRSKPSNSPIQIGVNLKVSAWSVVDALNEHNTPVASLLRSLATHGALDIDRRLKTERLVKVRTELEMLLAEGQGMSVQRSLRVDKELYYQLAFLAKECDFTLSKFAAMSIAYAASVKTKG